MIHCRSPERGQPRRRRRLVSTSEKDRRAMLSAQEAHGCSTVNSSPIPADVHRRCESPRLRSTRTLPVRSASLKGPEIIGRSQSTCRPPFRPRGAPPGVPQRRPTTMRRQGFPTSLAGECFLRTIVVINFPSDHASLRAQSVCLIGEDRWVFSCWLSDLSHLAHKHSSTFHDSMPSQAVANGMPRKFIRGAY